MLGDSTPTLVGTSVILRAPRETDRSDRMACGRDPETVRMCGGDYRHLRSHTNREELWQKSC